MEVPQNTEELSYDLAIPLFDIYPNKTIIQKDSCIPMFIAALFTVAKMWKQPECPSANEWIKKMWCIYRYHLLCQHRRKSQTW